VFAFRLRNGRCGRGISKGEKMTDREQLIIEIREQLSRIPKGTGSIDSISVANKLGESYSIPLEEIRALVIKEADAAGISHF
jgi:hypothetical protein